MGKGVQEKHTNHEVAKEEFLSRQHSTITVHPRSTHTCGKKSIKFKDKHGGRLTLLLLTCIFQHTAGCCYSCTWSGDTRIPYHRLDGCTGDATSLFHQGQQVRVAHVHRAVVRPGVSENFARHSYAVERMLWHHQLET